jgi:hypothetical protein
MIADVSVHHQQQPEQQQQQVPVSMWQWPIADNRCADGNGRAKKSLAICRAAAYVELSSRLQTLTI